MKALVLATENPHKAEEIRAILAPMGIVVLDRPPDAAPVDEGSDTLEGNALLKARGLAGQTGQPAVSDDTGLFVDALDGRPGVRSARYAGARASDDENVAKLLDEMRDTPPQRRTARFRTVIAVAYPDGEWLSVDGVLEGTISDAPRGDGGFGYDPVFVPEGAHGRTLAELTPEEKNETSHRARALRALAKALAAR